MSERTVAVDPKKLVIITENYGGYLGGECVVCGASGWLSPRYGYPHNSKKGLAMGNRIIHKEDCPMSKVLNENGDFL